MSQTHLMYNMKMPILPPDYEFVESGIAQYDSDMTINNESQMSPYQYARLGKFYQVLIRKRKMLYDWANEQELFKNFLSSMSVYNQVILSYSHGDIWKCTIPSLRIGFDVKLLAMPTDVIESELITHDGKWKKR